MIVGDFGNSPFTTTGSNFSKIYHNVDMYIGDFLSGNVSIKDELLKSTISKQKEMTKEVKKVEKRSKTSSY